MNLDIMRGVVSIVLRQRGNRLDCVTPSSVAAGLAGIALLPSILGDLSYMSPVVPVTVGLLDERGLDALQDFAAAVFTPPRMDQDKPHPPISASAHTSRTH